MEKNPLTKQDIDNIGAIMASLEDSTLPKAEMVAIIRDVNGDILGKIGYNFVWETWVFNPEDQND